jgi:F0F1-type ATP synthase membrane subunit c/vacuolar-type H+-ATPase subunit K
MNRNMDNPMGKLAPTPAPLRTGQILIAALLLGMLSFSGIAAAMAGKAGSHPDPKLATTLFIVLGLLAVTELTVFLALVRPTFIRQVRADSQSRDEASRDSFLQQRFLTLTILSGALAEGLGLFGAVIVLLTGKYEALAAPALAAVALLLVLPTPARFDRFKQSVSDQAFQR